MSAYDLKKELIALIENTNDEELLSLLKDDRVFYGKVRDTDNTNDLNDEQLEELKALSEEDERADVHSVDEFKIATQRWRTN